jgi:hypothetical protein
MRIVSELIKPSVHLRLCDGCPIANIDSIEACATVTQIQVHRTNPPLDFHPDAVQRMLHTIAKRNRELARFIADPREYPGDELLALMGQFDSSPTGRYMLARCFPGIPSFFKITITDSPLAGLKKRKRSL